MALLVQARVAHTAAVKLLAHTDKVGLGGGERGRGRAREGGGRQGGNEERQKSDRRSLSGCVSVEGKGKGGRGGEGPQAERLPCFAIPSTHLHVNT